MKKRFGLLFVIVLGLALVAGAWIRFFPTYRPWQETSRPEVVISVRNALRLAVLEINISQLYEVTRENLTISLLTIPFTSQKSMIAVHGQALLGYDLEKVKVVRMGKGFEVMVTLPPVELLSLDLQPRFLLEKDTFLNRIRPEDRNQILGSVRDQVRDGILRPDMNQKVAIRAETILKELSDWSGFSISIWNEP